MESSLKQRIYKNILRFMENYRYIKSTAEATIPNFIFQNSPLLSLFYVVRFWGRPLIFDGKSTLLPMDGSPNQTNQSPVRSSVSNSRAYSRRLWGSFAWLRAATWNIFLAAPRLWYSILRNITRPFFGVCLFRFRFLPIVDSFSKRESNAILKL